MKFGLFPISWSVWYYGLIKSEGICWIFDRNCKSFFWSKTHNPHNARMPKCANRLSFSRSSLPVFSTITRSIISSRVRTDNFLLRGRLSMKCLDSPKFQKAAFNKYFFQCSDSLLSNITSWIFLSWFHLQLFTWKMNFDLKKYRFRFLDRKQVGPKRP